ncbi:MAG: ATP phosphoribosyltransferase [Candidatus Muproteobacteria bacterium RIFCSPHIGHO2_01_FULL_65_16]|uniref:ATP phosphoribosyltransferase n=2 Tax=Candidatus Muproteobacteria TaxID=1817795 RepID=A0A1F6TE08_9PROT|nr:MAG: ATP phosphoribosyltransferase [Candidatus Muproteobacteria bacterium RBG_16_65_31]OGI46645.1 MAG: ATP phosphoribosyltransferase [Candidatus Muproteobacteria bacterium RIFCSPHIGHO2_01_FULL_65_16]
MLVLNIALSKGRILEESLPLLARAGVKPVEDPLTSRKLILDTNLPDVKLTVIRAADVPTYVQFGAADLGIAGKDVLMEYDGDGLYELLDLKIARCRMMVAEPASLAARDDPESWTRVRVATKYVKTTQRHFAAKGIQTDIIKLYGSMELAPLVGLSDRIVDLVASGQTLKANGLIAVERIADISAWLVANKAALKMKRAPLKALVDRIAGAVE